MLKEMLTVLCVYSSKAITSVDISQMLGYTKIVCNNLELLLHKNNLLQLHCGKGVHVHLFIELSGYQYFQKHGQFSFFFYGY